MLRFISQMTHLQKAIENMIRSVVMVDSSLAAFNTDASPMKRPDEPYLSGVSPRYLAWSPGLDIAPTRRFLLLAGPADNSLID